MPHKQQAMCTRKHMGRFFPCPSPSTGILTVRRGYSEVATSNFLVTWSYTAYRKIPKISPGAYIFPRPFLRGLFLERPIFGGACVRREIYVSKSVGLPCSGKEIYHFCFVLLCIRGQIPSTSPPGDLFSEGRFNGGFFALRFWGGLYLEGLIHGGAYFRNFTVLWDHGYCCLLF